MIKKIMVLSIIYLCSSPLFAQSITLVDTQNMYDACKQYFYVVEAPTKQEETQRIQKLTFNETLMVGRCMGFFDGYAGFQSMILPDVDKRKLSLEPLNYCLSHSLTNGQIVKIFMKYVEKHPESLNQPASQTISKSLMNAYPCKR